MPVLRYVLFPAWLVLLWSGLSCCAQPRAFEHRQYLKTTGDQVQVFDWHLVHGERLKLDTRIASEHDITHMDMSLATHSWSVHDPESGTDVHVVRNNGQLLFKGVFKGREIKHAFAVDESPWYQALSLSLRPFAHTQVERMEFWSIRPDTLDVHRLQVRREGEEFLMLNGESVASVKLKIQLTGMKSIFWSCYYWLRKSDGVFVRYEGPSGPPGWPLTTIELLEVQHRSDLTRKHFSMAASNPAPEDAASKWE